jgi:hypothetical protein
LKGYTGIRWKKAFGIKYVPARKIFLIRFVKKIGPAMKPCRDAFFTKTLATQQVAV